MYSIISAEITENTIAETTGLQLKHKPIATPARPAWERASPMEESLFYNCVTNQRGNNGNENCYN